MTSTPALHVPTAAPERIPPPERDAITTAITELLASGPYIGGPAVETFEHDFAEYVGTVHAIGVDNGSNALTIALHALELPRGGIVLVPPNDGGFAAAATQAAGLVPRVVDVDPGTGLLTAETLQANHDARVVAVVVTHLHGLMADMAPIAEWSDRHGLALLEDCAQAHGARRDDRHAGTYGAAATFSFYPTKNLGALGDAGAIVTDRADLADRARSLRQYGWSPRFLVADGRGRNSRLDALQAAILTARLPFLDQRNAARRSVLRRYRAAAPGLSFLRTDDATDVVHHAVVRTPDRDRLRDHLLASGVGVDVHYPFLVQEMPGVSPVEWSATPYADTLRRECLSLPCFPGLTDDEVDAVCSALSAWRAP